jgi:hypothetical protein
MKGSGLRVAVLAMALGATASAQSGSSGWVGIWHADVGGQATSTLTLANDTGALGGTLVLDMIRSEGGEPHVIASEPHLLMNAVTEGNTLRFQVKIHRPDGSEAMASFEVKRTAVERASLHCVSCGANAPVVEMVKGL